MNTLNKIRDWLGENWGWLLVISVLAFTFVADVAMIRAKTKSSEEIVACKTLCFPQQSEYLKQGDAYACWCYVDSETIKKSQ